MKKADPLAPMAMGLHRDSFTTKASAMSPVAHPIRATPSSHLTVSDRLVLFGLLGRLSSWGRISS